MRRLSDCWTRELAHRHPYTWLQTRVGELFNAETEAALYASFPTSGFDRFDTSSRLTEKTYRNFSREIVSPDGRVVPDLPLCWRELVEDLCSDEYRSAVAALLDIPVARRVEIRLVRHGQRDWLSAHTDRVDKLFSHILYFNRVWLDEWDGCFEVLAEEDMSVVARIAPVGGTSVLLARSNRSWHRVAPIKGDATVERRSLLVHGVR